MQISDVGAQMLVDALVMDRGMKLLDLSANQLTTKRQNTCRSQPAASVPERLQSLPSVLRVPAVL